MTPPGPPAELLTSGEDDDPIHVARRRRRWRRAAVVVAAAAVLAAVGTGRLGLGLSDDGTGPQLPAEPAGSLVTLTPEDDASAHVDVPRRPPHAVTVQCVGEGTILVRVDGFSWVHLRCAPERPRSRSRDVSPHVSGDTLVSTSTVSTTTATEWRVSVHPAHPQD